jgi:SET domain-containing protein
MGLSNNLSLLKDIETGERFCLDRNRAYIEPNALAKPKKKKIFCICRT